jgi:hypothetical protein
MAGRVLPYGAFMAAGQRFYAPTSDAWNPLAIGTQAAVTANVVPSVAVTSAYARNDMHVNEASASPFDFFKSPVMMLIAFILISFIGLHFIHFKG